MGKPATPRKGSTRSPSDDQEEAFALSAATSVLEHLAPSTGKSAEAIACAVISRWIVERVKMAAGRRTMFDTVVFDLGQSKMRGQIEAALPAIAAQLAHIPADKPLFELDREQVIDVFVAAIRSSAQAHLAMQELDDEVPF